jgi:hypothetical protein
MAVVEIPAKLSLDIDDELDFRLARETILALADDLVSRGALSPA